MHLFTHGLLVTLYIGHLENCGYIYANLSNGLIPHYAVSKNYINIAAKLITKSFYKTSTLTHHKILLSIRKLSSSQFSKILVFCLEVENVLLVEITSGKMTDRERPTLFNLRKCLPNKVFVGIVC